jgi:hypothetical protein
VAGLAGEGAGRAEDIVSRFLLGPALLLLLLLLVFVVAGWELILTRLR